MIGVCECSSSTDWDETLISEFKISFFWYVFLDKIVILATYWHFRVQSLVGRRLNSLTKQKFYESFLNYINPYFPSLVASLSPTLNTFNYKEI